MDHHGLIQQVMGFTIHSCIIIKIRFIYWTQFIVMQGSGVFSKDPTTSTFKQQPIKVTKET